MVKKYEWLPKGIVLGLVFFLAILIIKPVGVSTQFSVVSGVIYSKLDPDLIVEDDTRDSGYRSSNAYYDKDNGKLAANIKHPWTYDLIFVLAIPLGALAGYLLIDHKKRIRVIKEDKSRVRTSKKHFFKKYGISFLAGFLILFGSRMAGGCTSGHMMSGMMQGSVSGYLFAAAAFITAIPTAMLAGSLGRKER